MAHDALLTSGCHAGGDPESFQGWDPRSIASLNQETADGCAGVKSYPRGVTTNSSSGIEDYSVYYPVFKAMEEEGMILNLHGEVPSDHAKVSFLSPYPQPRTLVGKQG